MAILSLDGLSTGYNSQILLRDICFSLQSPSLLAIVGNNGCGKSTLLKTISGQHDDYQGSIFLSDLDLKNHSLALLNKKLSFLAQHNSITFSISVLEVVVMGLFSKKKLFENYSKEDYSKALSVIKELEIDHLAERDYLTLSGGEKQLAWIAQVLTQDVPIMLFDEPMQHLDIYHRKKIFDLFNKAVYSEQKTIIFSTHDLEILKKGSGHLLNLSEHSPECEKLNPESVDKAVRTLEQKRN
ncbi:MAG: ABC transporter ATP-binding protein [Cytophagaceae bacterium]